MDTNYTLSFKKAIFLILLLSITGIFIGGFIVVKFFSNELPYVDIDLFDDSAEHTVKYKKLTKEEKNTITIYDDKLNRWIDVEMVDLDEAMMIDEEEREYWIKNNGSFKQISIDE